ncbi:MAG: D-alanyl-D-alanine carboxypeptidase [Anaerolineae bacterium]|nr:D-alanyl-D-alanine carboxypeptidase [Anaerolineae bacterium]
MGRASGPVRLLIILALALGQGFCVGFGPPRLSARDVDDNALWPHQVRLLGELSVPAVSSAAALLLDAGTGTRIYEKHASARLAPASTTKMVTALVAIERGHLDDTVTIYPADLTVESLLGLRVGETWSLEDLLYALLLSSDNAAALAIARHVAGSEAAFVSLMNEQVTRWGLRDTHFANPHGLDDPEHYSSAADLAEIALRCLENPVFAAIVRTRERRAGWRTLVNLNELLRSYEGAQGVKTGTTAAAGQCLVSIASRPGGRAVCVVLGSDDRYRDTRLLLDYYFAHYRAFGLQLGPKGLNRVREPDGREQVLIMDGHPQVLLPLWQLPWLRLHRVVPPLGPDEGGTAAGLACFRLGSAVLAEVPLQAVAP